MWFAHAEQDLINGTYLYAGPTPVTTSADEAGAAFFVGIMIFYFLVIFVFSVLSIIALWRIFNKAGEAGWKSIIPFYNIIVYLKVVGRPGWWLLLLFVPIAQLIVLIITALDLAKSFGRSDLFGIVAIFLFGPIGHLIIAFSKDTYKGPAGLGVGGGTVPPAQTPFQTTV